MAAPTAETQVCLVIVKPDGSQKEIPLREGSYVVGRQSGVGLRIPAASVSRKHAELNVSGTTLSVKDLGSSNGTYRNDQKLEGESELSAGDVLGIGPARMTVRINGEPSEIGGPKAPRRDDPMAETPPAGSEAVGAGPGAGSAGGKSADESDDDIDSELDETVTKQHGLGGLLSEEDSSVFDFDFDLDEEDDNPKL